MVVSRQKGDGTFEFLKSKPNVVVEWLTFLFRIRKVSGSNFVLEAGYLD
jgi:hypothetical protein